MDLFLMLIVGACGALLYGIYWVCGGWKLAENAKIRNANYIRDRLYEITRQVLEEVPPDHLKTLARKRRTLMTRDDYGNVVDNGWAQELSYYYDNVLFARLIPKRDAAGLNGQVSLEIYPVAQNWKNVVVSYVDAQIANVRVETPAAAPTDPYQYEQWCAEILEAAGWNARRTSGSGDQGADVIADKDGVSVVIQCKLFSSPVGNKAVQEVTSARIFYGASHAVVVSNQGYTPSARKLAAATGVILIHHDDLPRLPEKLEKIFDEKGL